MTAYLRLLLATLWLGLWVDAIASNQSLPPEIPIHQLVNHNWTVTDGLPQITVTEITQDHAGYIWMGTQGGLARFDGHRFKVFDSFTHPALGHNFVNTVMVGDDGMVWAGSERGLSWGNQSGFTAVPGSAKAGGILDLMPDGSGGVWVGTRRGLFHATKERIRQLPAAEDGVPVTSLTRSRKGQLHAATENGLLVNVEQASKALAPTTIEGGLRNIVRVLALPNGDLWLAGENAVIRVDETFHRQEVLLEGRNIEAMTLDASGSLWISTDNGLYRRTPDGNLEHSQVAGLGVNSWIRGIFQDNRGNLWVGTQLNGLFRLYAGRFRRMGAVDGLTDEAVWSVYSDPTGGVWAGATDGAYYGGLSGFTMPFQDEELPHPMTLSLLRDSTGGLWIGTRMGLAYQPPGSEATLVRDDIPATVVNALHEDAQGRVWVGSNAGLHRIDRPWGETRALDLNALVGPGSRVVRSIAPDVNGQLWLATETGIYRQTATDFTPVTDDQQFHAHSFNVLPIAPDTALATFAQGLAWLGPDTERMLGRRDGLHSDTFMYVTVENDTLWFNTPDGVGKTALSDLRAYVNNELKSLPSRVYGRADSAQPAQCNGGQRNSGALTSGRWIWCPSLSGLMALDLKRAQANAQAPIPVIQTLRYGDESRLLESRPGHSEALQLPTGARDLEIMLTGIHYRNNSKMRFLVQLEGWDNEWQELADRRTAIYTNMPWGEYHFKVLAVNEDGVVSEQPARLTLYLPPLWQETLWAKAGMVLGIALLIWLGVWLRFRRMEAHRRKLRETVEERTRQLRKANQKLQDSALTDPLTGLRNRRFLHEFIDVDFAQAIRKTRTANKPRNSDIAFIMMDLDHFKTVNDRYGHAAGDEVLKHVARLMREQVRESDHCLRWGGEEFLLVIRHTEASEVNACVERLMHAIRNATIEAGTARIQCTCSIGFTLFPPSFSFEGSWPSWEQVVDIADAAGYMAKREGRDRWIRIDVQGAWWQEGFFDMLQQDPEQLVESGAIRIEREQE